MSLVESIKLNDGVVTVEEKESNTYRFVLDLKITEESSFPEFDYKRLLRKQVKNKSFCANDFDNDDSHDVKVLAKKFEEKYGGSPYCPKKNAASDFVDIGYGYDDSDTFIDNSEAYDELVPDGWTAEYGGFYINQGNLDFKSLKKSNSSVLEDLPRKKKKKKKKSEKNKLLKTSIEDGLNKKKNINSKEKHRKSVFLKAQKILVKTKKKPLVIIKDVFQDVENIPLAKLSKSFEDDVPLSKIAKTNEVINLSKSNDLQVDDNTPLGKILATPSSSETTTNTTLKSSFTSGSANNVIVNITPTAVKQPTENPKTTTPKVFSALPEGLSKDLLKDITELKQLSELSVKGKFFNPEVNKVLLRFARKCRQQSPKLRSAVYDHILYYLPCAKDTLVKRCRALVVQHQRDLEDEPMKLLKEAIETSMPAQKKAYEEELAAALQEQAREQIKQTGVEPTQKGEQNENSNNDEEKNKKTSIPKKKYLWSDTVRKLLCDVTRVRVDLFKMSKSRSMTAEEFVKDFLESEIRVMWPKGWMTSRILYRESRIAHQEITQPLAKGKKFLKTEEYDTNKNNAIPSAQTDSKDCKELISLPILTTTNSKVMSTTYISESTTSTSHTAIIEKTPTVSTSFINKTTSKLSSTKRDISRVVTMASQSVSGTTQSINVVSTTCLSSVFPTPAINNCPLLPSTTATTNVVKIKNAMNVIGNKDKNIYIIGSRSSTNVSTNLQHQNKVFYTLSGNQSLNGAIPQVNAKKNNNSSFQMYSPDLKVIADTKTIQQANVCMKNISTSTFKGQQRISKPSFIKVHSANVKVSSVTQNMVPSSSIKTLCSIAHSKMPVAVTLDMFKTIQAEPKLHPAIHQINCAKKGTIQDLSLKTSSFQTPIITTPSNMNFKIHSSSTTASPLNHKCAGSPIPSPFISRTPTIKKGSKTSVIYEKPNRQIKRKSISSDSDDDMLSKKKASHSFDYISPHKSTEERSWSEMEKDLAKISRAASYRSCSNNIIHSIATTALSSNTTQNRNGHQIISGDSSKVRVYFPYNETSVNMQQNSIPLNKQQYIGGKPIGGAYGDRDKLAEANLSPQGHAYVNANQTSNLQKMNVHASQQLTNRPTQLSPVISLPVQSSTSPIRKPSPSRLSYNHISPVQSCMVHQERSHQSVGQISGKVTPLKASRINMESPNLNEDILEFSIPQHPAMRLYQAKENPILSSSQQLIHEKDSQNENVGGVLNSSSIHFSHPTIKLMNELNENLPENRNLLQPSQTATHSSYVHETQTMLHQPSLSLNEHDNGLQRRANTSKKQLTPEEKHRMEQLQHEIMMRSRADYQKGYTNYDPSIS